MKPTNIKGKCIKVPTKIGLVKLLENSLVKKTSNIFSTRKKAKVISTKPTKKMTQKHDLIIYTLMI